MFKYLKKYCGEVIHTGSTPIYTNLIRFVLRGLAFVLLKVFKKRYLYVCNPFLCRIHAIFWENKLSKEHFDLIFAPAASTDIAFLDTKIPIIYLSDTTFSLLHGYYPSHSNLLKISIRDGKLIDQLAIEKSSLLIFSSEWAANSAISDYGADKEKIRVIPFGANLNEIPSDKFVFNRDPSDICRLVFLGTNWNRKGGTIAFETLLELEKMGVKSELIVCGCTPPSDFRHRNMKVISFAPKIADILSKADFLLLPTRAECYGIVFCEANAYGIPAITTDTGGVSGLINNGENGFMLPLTATGSDYAKIIRKIWQDKKSYNRLRKMCRKAFDKRLNWDSWGLAIRDAIGEILDIGSSP